MLQAKLGRRLSARVMSLISPSKEKSKKEAELAAPSETTEGAESSKGEAVAASSTSDATAPPVTSDEAPSVTTEIPAGSLITASTPIVPEINTSSEDETRKEEETTPATTATATAPPAAPVVAGELQFLVTPGLERVKDGNMDH